MGKPAARIGDQTAHGGVIVGPGIPTVLIGGKPASVMGDMHTCPMVSPGPVPHVGGPVIAASAPTVLIGGKPVAVVGDQATCTGPPDVIVAGEMTVLIGSGGGGGGGAGQAGGSGQVEAKTVGYEGQKGHFFAAKFVDKSGKPIMGVNYKMKNPDGTTSEGTITGKIKKSGIPEGNAQIELRSITKCAWSKKEARDGEKVKLQVETAGIEDGTEAEIQIWEKDINRASKVIHSIEGLKTRGGKIEAEWKYGFSEMEEDEEDEDIEKTVPVKYSSPQYFFTVGVGGCQSRSSILDYKDWIEIELADEEGKAAAGEAYKVYLSNGEVRTGKLDGSGKAKIKDVPPGDWDVDFPDIDMAQEES